MVDVWVQACFAVSCAPPEMAQLEEACQASYDLREDCTPDPVWPSPALQTLFPGTDDDRWAGFRDIFSDRAFPSLGAVLRGSNQANPATVTAIIISEAAFDPEAVARIRQRGCPVTLRETLMGFEWNVTATRMRVDESGGGYRDG